MATYGELALVWLHIKKGKLKLTVEEQTHCLNNSWKYHMYRELLEQKNKNQI